MWRIVRPTGMSITSAKAYGASVFLHVGAIGILSGLASREADESTRFQGARHVILAEWSAPAAPSDPPPLTLDATPAEDRVLIRPRSALVERRRLVETDSHDVASEELLPTFDVPNAIPAAPPPMAGARSEESAPDPASTPPRTKPLERSVRPVQPRSVASAASAPTVATLGTDETSPATFANNNPPRYPEQARRARWEGTVVLALSVDVEGRVTDVRVQESSGYEVLDAAAVAAIRQWRGVPARRSGTPVPSVEILPVRFRL